jgi:transposase-like protein
MNMAKGRNFSDQFKAKVVLESLRGDKTAQEIAAKYLLHPKQVITFVPVRNCFWDLVAIKD